MSDRENSIIGSVPFADRKAERALAEHYGEVRICRTVCDGQKGYGVVLKNGASFFHFRLGSAFRQVLEALGHAEDRELIVVGEPEVGNAWRVDA